MRHRCPPLWLLRDITASAALMAAIWALTLQMFATAFMAERRKQSPSPSARSLIYSLLARVEEALDYVISRQAHRLLGLSTKAVTRQLYEPATDHATFAQRFHHHIHCLENIDAVARQVADELRRRLNITKAEAEAVRTFTPRTAASGLPQSPRDWGRWIGASSRRDGGGLSFCPNARTNTRARGPPARLSILENRTLSASAHQRLRAPSRA
jgi:hypothetical protein